MQRVELFPSLMSLPSTAFRLSRHHPRATAPLLHGGRAEEGILADILAVYSPEAKGPHCWPFLTPLPHSALQWGKAGTVEEMGKELTVGAAIPPLPFPSLGPQRKILCFGEKQSHLLGSQSLTLALYLPVTQV